MTWTYSEHQRYDPNGIRVATYHLDDDKLKDTHSVQAIFCDNSFLLKIKGERGKILGTLDLTYGNSEQRQYDLTNDVQSILIYHASEVSSINVNLKESIRDDYSYTTSCYNYAFSNDHVLLSGYADTMVIKSCIGRDVVLSDAYMTTKDTKYDVIDNSYTHMIVYDDPDDKVSVSSKNYDAKFNFKVVKDTNESVTVDGVLLFDSMDRTKSVWIKATEGQMYGSDYLYLEDILESNGDVIEKCVFDGELSNIYAYVKYTISGVTKYSPIVKINLERNVATIDQKDIANKLVNDGTISTGDTTAPISDDYALIKEILSRLTSSSSLQIKKIVKIAVEWDPSNGEVNILVQLGKSKGLIGGPIDKANAEDMYDDYMMFTPKDVSNYKDNFGYSGKKSTNSDIDDFVNRHFAVVNDKTVSDYYKALGSMSYSTHHKANFYYGGFVNVKIGYDNGTPVITSWKASVSAGINFEVSIGGTVLFMGFPFYWEAGLSNNTSLTYELGHSINNNGKWDVTSKLFLKCNNEIYIGGGIGVRGILCGGLRGAMDVNMAFCISENTSVTTIQFKAYAYVKALSFEQKVTLAITDPITVPSGTSSKLDVLFAQVDAMSMSIINHTSTGTSGWSILSNEYRDNRSDEWRPWTYDDENLEQWAYPYSDPAVISSEGQTLMVMLSDSGSADTSPQIMFSWYDGGAWSIPAQLAASSGKYHDYGFQLYSIDDEIYVIWSRIVTKDTLKTSMTQEELNALLANSELWVAKWDGYSKIFISQTKLTSNSIQEDKYGMTEHTVSDGISPAIYWVQEDANGVEFYISTLTNGSWFNSKINNISLSGSNHMIREFTIYDYTNDSYKYAISYTYKGSDDTMCTSVSMNGASVDDDSITNIVEVNGTIYCIKNAKVCKYNPSTDMFDVIYDKNVGTFEILVSDNGTYMFWISDDVLYSAILIDNTFYGPITVYIPESVKDNEGNDVYEYVNLSSVSITCTDSDSFLCVFSVCSSDTESFDYSDSPMSIICKRIILAEELGIEANYRGTLNGKELIDVVVTNNGPTKITGVSIKICDKGLESYYQVTDEGEFLMPGESRSLSIEYMNLVNEYRSVCVSAINENLTSDVINIELKTAASIDASVKYHKDGSDSSYFVTLLIDTTNCDNLSALLTLDAFVYGEDGNRLTVNGKAVKNAVMTFDLDTAESKVMVIEIPFSKLFSYDDGGETTWYHGRNVLREFNLQVLNGDEVVAEASKTISFYNFCLVSVYMDYGGGTSNNKNGEQIYGYSWEKLAVTSPILNGYKFTGNYVIDDIDPSVEDYVDVLPEYFPEHSKKFTAVYVKNDGNKDYSGNCSKSGDTKYVISKDNEEITLTIYGTGVIEARSWNSNYDELREYNGDNNEKTHLKVVIMEGVKGITSDVFAGYDSMVSISIPSSLKEIYSGTFNGCTALSAYGTITISENNDDFIVVNNMLFERYTMEDGRSGLKLLVCPDSTLNDMSLDLGSDTIGYAVISIGQYAFYNSGIISVNAPNLLEIETYAFAYCEELNTVIAPNLETIGECAFKKCISLNRIGNDGNNGIVVSNATLRNVSVEAFIHCRSIASVDLSEMISLGYICENAFYDCRALSELVLPTTGSLMIGSNAFAYSSLETIEITPAVISLSSDSNETYGAFRGINTLKSFTVSSGVTKYRTADGILYASINDANTKFILVQYPDQCATSTINIEKDVTSIVSGSLSGFTNISKITVHALNEKLFVKDNILYKKGTTNDPNVILLCCPSGIRTDEITINGSKIDRIDSNAFNNVVYLEKIKLTGDIYEISSYGFTKCLNLKDIDMSDVYPNIILNIGAFTGCPSLEKITFPEVTNSGLLTSDEQCSAILLTGLDEKTTMLYVDGHKASWKEVLSKQTFDLKEGEDSMPETYEVEIDAEEGLIEDENWVKKGNKYVRLAVSGSSVDIPVITYSDPNKKSDVVLNCDGATIAIPTSMIKNLKGNTNDSVSTDIRSTDNSIVKSILKKYTNNMDLYTFNLFVGDSSIHDLGGRVLVTIPYTLKDGESAEDVCLYYINEEDDTLEDIESSYDEETGLLTAYLTHFSLYGVGDNIHTVTFDSDGGTSFESQEVTTGNTATEPTDDPTKEHYNFLGWYLGTELYDFNTAVNSDTILTAHWSPKEYNYSFVTKGGSPIASGTYTIESEDIMLPTTSLRTGYDFLKWYDNEDLSGDPVIKIPNGSYGIKVFYAKWSPVEYDVVFNINGGSALSSLKYTIEDEKIVLPTTSEKKGYRFAGWYDNAELSGNEIKEISTGSVGKVNIFAKWIVVSYLLKFNVNGGDAIDDITYNVASEKIVLPTPTKEGYNFKGWYDNESLSGETVTEVAAGSVGDQTYYASWEKIDYTPIIIATIVVGAIAAGVCVYFLMRKKPSKE